MVGGRWVGGCVVVCRGDRLAAVACPPAWSSRRTLFRDARLGDEYFAEETTADEGGGSSAYRQADNGLI